MFNRKAPPLDDLFRKRERDPDGVHLSDAEFFALLREDDLCLVPLVPCIRRKQWEEAAGHLLEHYRDRYLPTFFFSPAGREEQVGLLVQNRGAVASCMEWAEQSCNHVFYSPYTGASSMGPYVDWYSDLQGNSWFCEHVSGLRQKIFADRLHEQMGLGDPQVTWEFNQHEHLVELGKAYWLSNDERYSCEFVIQVVDWIEKNGCQLGINWVDEKCVAQRTINWIWALNFFLPSDHVSPNFLLRALKSLALHGAFLHQYLKSQPQDQRPLYRLSAACALYMLAQFLPELQAAKGWLVGADQAVTRAVLDDFTSDGGHRSGSLDAHRLGLELALTHYLLAILNGESADNMPTRPRLLDALRFLAEIATPAGTFQPLGAGFPTRALPFGTPFVADPRAVLAIGALLFNRRDFKSVAGETPPWQLTWLMGPTARDRYMRLEAEPPTDTSTCFPHSGYHILRDGWGPKDFWLLFRSGSSPDPLHDDRFHVSLSVGGESIFTDLGTCASMAASPSWFDHTHTHNVLALRHTRAVPSQSQETPSLMRTGGRYWLRGGSRTFQVDRHARGGPVAEQPRPELDLIEYRRELLVDMADKWVIFRDVLQGSGELDVDALFYHLPGLDLVQRGDQGCVLWKKGAWLRIQPYFPGNFRWFWDRPRAAGQPPYWSPDGVTVQPAYALRYHSTVTLPCEVYFWIHWDAGSAASPDLEDIRRYFHALPART